MIDRILDSKIKHKALYILKFEDKSSILFHAITWGEFKAVRDTLVTYPHLEIQIKEYLFRKCIIEYIGTGGMYKSTDYSVDDLEMGYTDIDSLLEYIPAGVVDTIGNLIISISGPMNENELFNHINDARNMIKYAAEDRILSIVSSLNNNKLSDLDKLEWNRIISDIALAELSMQGQFPEIPFRLNIPEDNVQKIDFEKENKEMI